MMYQMALSVLFLVVGWLLPGCGGGGGDEQVAPSSPIEPGPIDRSVVDITENVNTATTWKYPNIYVIRTLDFRVNNTLTIEPGVIVKFHPIEGPKLTLGGVGILVAKGTAEQPIIFTSFKDDAHGGDTNNDGNTTQAAAGDWERIDTNGLSGSVFEYCQFFYGGSKGVDLGTLLLNDSVAIVNNCTFAHNRGGKSVDLYDGALDASDALPGTVITNNVFFDNTLPLSINLTFSLDDSNTFHNPVAPEDKNTLNGIFVSPLYGRRLKGTITWQETEVPYVINKIDLWIDVGASLTLANNVVLKFTPNRQLIYDDNFINYAGEGVVFTSFQDDTLKGDTNGDGAATSPADYDWLGIYNRNSAVDGYESWPNIYYDSH